jgi:hypothetical protein
MVIGLDSDHILMVGHLQRGVGSVDDRHELQEERPPEHAVVPDVKAGYLEHQHFLVLVVPQSWQCGCKALQKDPDLSRHRLM